LKGIKDKKVKRFDNRRGPKRREKINMFCIVSWKAYFSSSYFFFILLSLHFIKGFLELEVALP
jgi:hypothetical protein